MKNEFHMLGNTPRKSRIIDSEEAIRRINEEFENMPETQDKRIQEQNQSPIAEPVSFDSSMVSSDYVQIPNQDFVTAIAETDFNFNYEETHKSVLKRGLFVPTPKKFMTFHNHIIDCYKNRKPIFDASGNPISNKIKQDLYKQLTSNCWTWLNGKFNILPNKKTIEYIDGLNANGDLLTRIENLEDYLMENCYVDFTKLNKQGLALPNSNHSNQDYIKGQNIYFYFPVNNCVAWFDADSDGADLGCVRDASSRGPSLGVRAVKQGLSKTRQGGLK